MPLQARTEIVRAAREELAWVELVTGVAPVAAVAQITQAAQQVLDRNPAYRAELRAQWLNPRQPSLGPSTLGPSTLGPPTLGPPTLGPPTLDLPTTGRDDETDPLVAVLGTAGDLAVDHLRAGYALQRVLLTLTDLGLCCSLFSQPIEVASAREQLRLALGRFGTPQMVLRIGYGDPGPRSARRAARDVIDG